MSWLAVLADFFADRAPLGPGERLVVAFSGGGDSTALLWGLTRLPGMRERLLAVHVDHGLDPGSDARARAARQLAARLDVPFHLARRSVDAGARAEQGLEAAARRVRYAALEAARRDTGARYVATAHHRDDQAETVLLRLRFGSGVLGMAGIRPLHGAVVRPLLDVPRAELAAAVAAAGLAVIDDPTNRDPAICRNHLRHHVLPLLARDEPELPARLARLAGRALAATPALERAVERALGWEGGAAPGNPGGETACERDRLAGLPPHVQRLALTLLARRAGAGLAARAAVATVLLARLAQGGPVALDAGQGWRWQADARRLRLCRREAKAPDFSYTLQVPGRLVVDRLALALSLARSPVEPWMFRGEPRRAALALPLAEGDAVTLRNRRPGDRVHPLGARGSRRLKEVLIDRHVPRAERQRLPLLCLGGEIAWVPGVTIDHRFRITTEREVWVAELSDGAEIGGAVGIPVPPARFLWKGTEVPEMVKQ